MAEHKRTEYSAEVLDYLHRIYDSGRQRFACRAESAEEVYAWQRDPCQGSQPSEKEFV